MQWTRQPIVRLTVAIMAVSSWSVSASAQEKSRAIDSDGTINVPAFRLPASPYLSDAARASLPRTASDPSAMLDRLVQSGAVPKVRASMRKAAAGKVDALRRQYGVSVEEAQLGGVHGYWVRPIARSRGGVRKLLINLPGGGFLVGDAASTGLIESIPLAGLGGFDIVTIDYRQAPEATFPAASEDVASVYRELLKTYKPRDIGIFGCSAGGLLTAQALAWFQKEGLPTPAAAGIFCASADARWAGDSWYWQRAMHGLTSAPSLDERFYYGDHDLDDPLMSPIRSDAVLKRFPPTLIITASRAGEMSAAINTHRLLVRNGVQASLHVWDGLDHAFYTQTDLPESREAFDVMVRFFQSIFSQKGR
ncbi:alpha/beta hydrolase fold domain-containing protein [Sphingobium sp. CAP-1]|uniref:alpha/beta hydrolase fold domain-containing protein n=1 Tax=Sphingobium sp. CAP-1 TaxID=2676077 RepID=UPI0012BB2118|nr:alpha/beta hydrolase fold domain-containing protein [Sphingobium sp. CAP-1]QGP81258.1 alpha/beta hydrolase fold domain-containing protein [Sphingobium sp. CAP-1]